MPAPDVLICSGLDPSGGAGFLADARVVSELGGRPVGVLTAQTVQSTLGLRSMHEVDREVFGEQLNALLTDVEVKAVKVGLLGSRGIVEELAAQLALTAAPMVWDPIAGASRGDPLLGTSQLEVALRELGRHLTLITPNVNELGLLTGAAITTLAEAIDAGRALAQSAKTSVLVKGGHLGTDESIDVLIHAGAALQLAGPRIATEDIHGTGCALSSAIATHLALGVSLVEACRHAKAFVASKIATPVRPGRGAPAIV